MKRIPVLLLSGMLLGPASAVAAERPLGSDVASLLAHAREHNPELAAMRHEADAAVQRVQPAGALPDPVLRAELMDFTNQGANKPASLWPSEAGSARYLLMQSVPWFGKRGVQREVAEAQALQAEGQVAATWAGLAGRIKAGYASYYYLSASEKLAQRSLALLDTLERLAQTRYANGLGTQQEAIRAQIEQTGLRAGLIELENEAHHQQSRLNALLSRPAMAELAEPAGPRPLPAAAQLEYPVLADRLRARNPQLRIAGARSSEAGKSRDLAHLNRYPGFTLGVAPTQSGNSVTGWDLMVEFNLPLQQESRRSQEREAASLLAAAEARRQALLDRMLGELSESVAGLEAARRSESLIATRLLPQSELTYQSALAGYEAGSVAFAVLLDAQRQILEAKRQLLKAQLEAQLRLAEIETLLGEEL